MGVNNIKDLTNLDFLFYKKNLNHLTDERKKIIIENFQHKINSIIDRYPCTNYVTILKNIEIYDNDYYNNKVIRFTVDVLNLINHIAQSSLEYCEQIMIDFVENCKKDLAIELFHMYNRFRHYPHERAIFFRKYKDHPYVLFLKELHYYYLESNKLRFIKRLKLIMVQNLLDVRFDEIIINMIKDRTNLFEFMHDLFIDTKKQNIRPKYNFNHNYFPFKVFSSKLFILEHLINI